MTTTRRTAGVMLAAMAVASASLSDVPTARSQVVTPTAPTTPSVSSFSGAALDNATQSRSGVVFQAGQLRLAKSRSGVGVSSLAVAATPVFGAAGDFNLDGMEDLVAGFTDGRALILRNNTGPVAPPALASVTPDFLDSTPLTIADGNGQQLLAVGDFNGDGKDDVFRAAGSTGSVPSLAQLWLNTTVAIGGDPTFSFPVAAMDGSSSPASLGTTDGSASGTSVAVADVNRDRRLDLIVGNADGTGGQIRLFTNTCTLATPLPTPTPAAPTPLPCSDQPSFHDEGILLNDLGLTSGEAPVFAYADFDLDGDNDLVVGGPTSADLRLYRGKQDGSFDATGSIIAFSGGATGIVAADLSHDGAPDLLVTTDSRGSFSGGRVLLYENSRSSVPFASSVVIADTGSPLTDTDFTVAINYDTDLDVASDDHVVDFIVSAAGRTTLDFYSSLLSTTEVVACGEVTSDVLDLAPLGLSATEMNITAARLQPTFALNGGTLQFFVSNAEPAEWVPAYPCDGTDFCVRFPKAAGRDLRWKAKLCGPSATATPTISDVQLFFDYIADNEHYQGGITVFDGVAYLGGFSLPGDHGQLYGVAANLDLTAEPNDWRARGRIDSMADSSRNIYAPAVNGVSLIQFNTSSAGNADLQSQFNVPDATHATDLINWARSARFGPVPATSSNTRFGAVVTSTPVVVGRPLFPEWYARSEFARRLDFDSFAGAFLNRSPLAYVGGKDGMIHALIQDVTDVDDASNFTEAWAYIPTAVADRLLADRVETLAAGRPIISAYPDTWPVIETVAIGPDLRTVAVFPSGKGGSEVFALDLTETIDEATSTILGPKPLWSVIPGDSDAGLALNRPAIARVNIGGNERFIVIAGTGIAFDDPGQLAGRVVAAYDIADGSLLWRFQTRCSLSTAISTFETNDPGEPGGPVFDGFIDRAVFADQCGYVYKIDPAKDLAGGWNDNNGLGAIPVDSVAGVQMYALFATSGQFETNRQQLPITGNIGVRSVADVDAGTVRVTLFFGTGGFENTDPNLQNAFFVMYADDIDLENPPDFEAKRDRIITVIPGDCTPPTPCEKFYGGVKLNNSQVVFARTRDPVIGSSAGPGDLGSTIIQGFNIQDFFDPLFNPVADVAFTADVGSAAYGPITLEGDALYVTTGLGTANVIGSPRTSTPGGDTNSGVLGEFTQDPNGEVDVQAPLRALGWRQLY